MFTVKSKLTLSPSVVFNYTANAEGSDRIGSKGFFFLMKLCDF